MHENMDTGIAEARAVAAAIVKEMTSVPRFGVLLQPSQGLVPPEEESAEACREAFLEKWKLRPPRFLRVIDCEASVEEGEVVLIDWDITTAAPAGSEIIDEEQAGTSSGEPSSVIASSCGVADKEDSEAVLMDWAILKVAPATAIVDEDLAGTSGDEDPAGASDDVEASDEDPAGTSGDEDSAGVSDDVEASDEESDEDDGGNGYCAISHTYGMYVYEVFDCSCAANCKAKVARADPEKTPCKGMHKDPELQQTVIRDILGMCRILVQAAAVRYAWHDGVCIAQHDAEEVQHFIRHMGWIYANAQSTIIFLHYIGRPMAPIGTGIPPFDLISRWQTRVWTFQEAALSRRRRYCVRTGKSMRGCSSLQEFEDTLASWYEEGSPNSIEVLEEEDFWDLVDEMLEVLSELPKDSLGWGDPMAAFKVLKWVNCLSMWISLLRSSCLSFPSVVHALDICSSRESKLEGDRINSILAVAGVQDFDAHKDHHVEQSTLEFFKRMQECNGLALALFTTNRYASPQCASSRKHTWFPTLSTSLMISLKHTMTREPNFDTEEMEFNVRDDGSLEVNGRLACVAAQFNIVEGEGAEANACTDGLVRGTHDQSINYMGTGMLNVLAIDLVNDQPQFGSFRAFVASMDTNHSGSIEIGSALLPTVERDSGGDMTSHSRDDTWVRQMLPSVEEWLHAVPTRNLLSAELKRFLALPALPDELWKHTLVQDDSTNSSSAHQLLPAELAATWDLSTDLPRSGAEGAAVRPACSFNALIVFPGKVLELDSADSTSISAFVVQGSDFDHSKVAKIGCFDGSPALSSILQQGRHAHTCCTFRNKLVVK